MRIYNIRLVSSVPSVGYTIYIHTYAYACTGIRASQSSKDYAPINIRSEKSERNPLVIRENGRDF